MLFIVLNRNHICARDSDILFSRRTLLHYSAEKGDIETCRLLLQSNANLEAKANE
jgi:ankyrin repeat protein